MSQFNLSADIDAYVRHGKSVGWTDGTIANYRHHLSILLRILKKRGCMRIADVTAADLTAVMSEAYDEGRAKKSRVQMAVLFKQTFQWLHDDGRILRNPALGLPLPHDGETDLPPRPLSEGEVQAIFASLPRQTVFDLRNACLLELIYGCGLRISEACGLDINDVDLTRHAVTVRNGKGGQGRILPLMETAAAAVRDWLAVRRQLLKGPDHGALFISHYGTRLQPVSTQKTFRSLSKERGPEMPRLHAHLFRHSIAVHLLRGGADVRYIQEFLGHGDLDTTKIYLRLVPGHLREDYDKAMPDIAVTLG